MIDFAAYARDHKAHPHCNSCGGCLVEPALANMVLRPLWCIACARRLKHSPIGLPPGAVEFVDLDKGSSVMTDDDIREARIAWEHFEAGCAGLLASQCKHHAPYTGCPLDCVDVDNAIGDEWKAFAPFVPKLLDECERLRADESVLLLSRRLGLGEPVRPDIYAATKMRLDRALTDRDRLRAENEALREQVRTTAAIGEVGANIAEETLVSHDRLRELLREAIELAKEGWGYAGDYFREKWEDGRLDAIAKEAGL